MTPSRALRLLVAAGLSLYAACEGKSREAATHPAPEAGTDAGPAAEAGTAEAPQPARQMVTVIPGQAVGRIRLGLTIVDLESLTADWRKEQLDTETVSLRKAPWRVLVKDGVATELTFTLEPHILPLVGNRSVRDTSQLAEVAKLFPDCQAPTVREGVDVISCQEGRTLLEKKGAGGNVEIHLVSPPPVKAKDRRSSPPRR